MVQVFVRFGYVISFFFFFAETYFTVELGQRCQFRNDKTLRHKWYAVLGKMCSCTEISALPDMIEKGLRAAKIIKPAFIL